MAVLSLLTEGPVPLRVILLVGNGLVYVKVALAVSVMAMVLAGEVLVEKLKVEPYTVLGFEVPNGSTVVPFPYGAEATLPVLKGPLTLSLEPPVFGGAYVMPLAFAVLRGALG